MPFQKIFVKIYIRLDASHDRITGGGRSCRHIYTCRRMPAAQQAGPCGSPQEDAGHERRSGTDRQTSPPPRRSSIAATYSAGYIDQLLYPVVPKQFVQTSCVQHTYQAVGGREGAGSIGRHIGEEEGEIQRAWLDRDMMGSIAEAGAAWLWDISAGWCSRLSPPRGLWFVVGRAFSRGVRGGRDRGFDAMQLGSRDPPVRHI